MKTLEELRAFAEGYASGVPLDDRPSTDDWVVWGGYDINLAGNDYAGPFNMETTSLYVLAYPAGWVDSLPDPIHVFVADAGDKP